MKYAMVPVEDIEKLEEARKKLFQVMDSLNIHSALLVPITDPMWKIANTKYQEIEGPR